jgi:DNA-binding MarR family transcriptional regulator
MARPRITDLHMLVLAWIGDHPAAFAEDVAVAFGLDLTAAHELCTDLEQAGYIARMAIQ